MKCPACGYTKSQVLDSRPSNEGESIRRRRECERCQKRFTTYEMIERVPIMVIKKDKTREAFDRTKIMNGIVRACEKRPVPHSVMEKAVSDIEFEITNQLQTEVSSSYIGELVMEKLRDIDEVAYVRFASVYRQFKDVNTFLEELKNLLGDSENH